jgi:predicted enzyme related to lactoylglutathione lyase
VPAGTTPEVQPHLLTPYLAVSDARRAIDWYVGVFAGQRRGEPIVMPDGWVGRSGPGDVGYVTMKVPDDEAAKRFYGSVLGWWFHPGSVEHGWQVADRTPPAGIGGGAEHPEVQLCYLVEDVDAAVHRVRAQGGEAEEPAVAPYGRIAACVDNQGMHFQLLQATGGAGAG